MTMENATDMQASFLVDTLLFETMMTPYEDDIDFYQHDADNFMRIFSMVSFSFTFLLGVAGNGIVIWVSTVKMSRTVTVIWFLHLAIADFIFDMFLPLQIVQLAMNHHWPFGNLLCKLSHMVLSLNMLASISFLVIISIDRCVSVLCPVWSRNHRTPKLACKVALVIWLLSVTFSAPYPAFYDLTPPSYSADNLTQCFMSYAVDVDDYSWEGYETMIMLTRIMLITRFMSMFLVPFVIIIICYGAIALKIRNRSHLTTSSKPFKIIISIMILFFVCWFPFHVIPLLDAYDMFIDWWFTFNVVCLSLSTCLAYFNTCLNPILYVFMGRDFKDTCRRSFLSFIERAFSEEPTMITTDTKSLPDTSITVESNLL